MTVTDGSGVSSTQPVTITVIGTNDAPTLTQTNPTLTQITEDQTTNSGAKAAELPVERLTRFELVLNLKAAKALACRGRTSCL